MCLAAMSDPEGPSPWSVASAIPISAFLAFGMAIGPMRRMAAGIGWTREQALLMAVFLAVTGLPAYFVIRNLAGYEISKYGVRKSTLRSYRKRDVMDAVRAMREVPIYRQQKEMEFSLE
jgi:hypothetical protein